MPLIAYLRAHGANDTALHYAFFRQLEQRGVLDRYDFALDPMLDYPYCVGLIKRFPQLQLTEDRSHPLRWMRFMRDHLGRGYRPLSYLAKFDAVCEAPGGRIHHEFTKHDIFRFYPRTKRRAILFHSIEERALENPVVKQSVAGADLVIARTTRSAKNARDAGAKHVIEAADIVFGEHPAQPVHLPGIAAVFRLPTDQGLDAYLANVREIIRHLERLPTQVDFVKNEEPLATEMRNMLLGTYCKPNTGFYADDFMYNPFMHRRDAIITTRLHTTLVSMIYGNRKIFFCHVQSGTNKTEETLRDIGLHSLKVFRAPDMTWQNVEQFLEEGPSLPEPDVSAALDLAKSKVDHAIDALLEWLESI
jgi:hypothetical protein